MPSFAPPYSHRTGRSRLTFPLQTATTPSRPVPAVATAVKAAAVPAAPAVATTASAPQAKRKMGPLSDLVRSRA
jgi:hypothetical protein